MKYLLLVTFCFFTSAAFGQTGMESYWGTTWEHSNKNMGIKVEFHPASTVEGAEVAKIHVASGDIVVSAEKAIFVKTTDQDGIHGGQDFIELYSSEFAEEGPFTGLFIAENGSCLLLPDTSAPEGCLRKVSVDLN